MTPKEIIMKGIKIKLKKEEVWNWKKNQLEGWKTK